MYKNAFSGYEAVDLIAYIIRTSDRNLALLLGRSLDAQKFFHEVAYAHRLRDSTERDIPVQGDAEPRRLRKSMASSRCSQNATHRRAVETISATQ